MPKLELSVAAGDYDRIRPLIDGTVVIDGVAPVFMALEPEEIFFRAFRHAEFDIAELSLSSFTVRTARGDNPYVGVPVFPSRAFRHSGIYIRTDRGIRAPADLKGRKVGLAEHQLTANVWIRAFLEDDFGVEPTSNSLGARRHRGARTGGKNSDCHAPWPDFNRGSPVDDPFGPFARRRNRRSHRPAHAVGNDGRQPKRSVGSFLTHAVRQSRLPTHEELPDHASDRGPQDACRTPPLAASGRP